MQPRWNCRTPKPSGCNGPRATTRSSRPASSSPSISPTAPPTSAPTPFPPAPWTAAFTKSPSNATAKWAPASWTGSRPGDKLWVIPPTGRFLPVLEPDKHLICIAGGSGVTPFRAFVREATRRRLATQITVLYSVKTAADIIFNDGIPQARTGKPPVQVPRHLHPSGGGRSLAGPARPDRFRLGARTDWRPAKHRFLRLRPQRPGGGHRTPRHPGTESPPGANEGGKMGVRGRIFLWRSGAGNHIKSHNNDIAISCLSERHSSPSTKNWAPA